MLKVEPTSPENQGNDFLQYLEALVIPARVGVATFKRGWRFDRRKGCAIILGVGEVRDGLVGWKMEVGTI